MVYGRSFRRKTYPKKRSFKRSRTYRKRSSRTRVSAPVKRYVKRTLSRNIETKYKLSARNAVVYRPIWDQALVQYLSCWPSTGTTDNNRIGDKIKVKHIDVWWEMTNYLSRSKDTIRLIFFQQKTEHDIDLDTILDSFFNGSVDLITAPYAHDYKGQVYILKDIVITNNELDASAIATLPKYGKVRLYPKQKTIKFSASSTVPLNNIGVLIISDKGIVSSVNNGPYVFMRECSYYTDA